MRDEREKVDADLAELDELLATLIELRADPPDGVAAADLPSLPEIAHGDWHLLALLEVRLERARARAGSEGEA